MDCCTSDYNIINDYRNISKMIAMENVIELRIANQYLIKALKAMGYKFNREFAILKGGIKSLIAKLQDETKVESSALVEVELNTSLEMIMNVLTFYNLQFN